MGINLKNIKRGNIDRDAIIREKITGQEQYADETKDKVNVGGSYYKLKQQPQHNKPVLQRIAGKSYRIERRKCQSCGLHYNIAFELQDDNDIESYDEYEHMSMDTHECIKCLNR